MGKFITLPNGSLVEDRRINSDSKQVWWIMGIIAVLTTGGFMGWLTSVNNLTLANSQKISSIESTVISVDKRLTRIEDKLDKAVSR